MTFICVAIFRIVILFSFLGIPAARKAATIIGYEPVWNYDTPRCIPVKSCATTLQNFGRSPQSTVTMPASVQKCSKTFELCPGQQKATPTGPWSLEQRLKKKDESKWPGLRCKEGGKRQSPIDIRTSEVISDFSKQYIKYGPLQFSGYHRVLVSGINNGHTIQFSSEGEAAIHPMLTGGPLKYPYRLEQLHFHWLSEHSINGVKYPMELHFVHVRADLSVIKALDKKDGLAIVSVFGNVQAELEDYQQEASEIMLHIPKLMNTGDRISGVLLDMTKLMSPNKENYYTYSGSLTSPECNEAVTWIIFDDPIFLTDAQYRIFGKVGIGRHNFRSLQKLNHHMIFTPGNTKLRTPQIVGFFGEVFKTFTDFFRNVGTFMAHSINTR